MNEPAPVGPTCDLAICGGGMVGATLVFSGRGPGGSVIVPETVLGTVWTIAVPILVAVVVVWPDRQRPRRDVAAAPDAVTPA